MNLMQRIFIRTNLIHLKGNAQHVTEIVKKVVGVKVVKIARYFPKNFAVHNVPEVDVLARTLENVVIFGVLEVAPVQNQVTVLLVKIFTMTAFVLLNVQLCRRIILPHTLGK